MPFERLHKTLHSEISELIEKGTAKAPEMVVTGVENATGNIGPRFIIQGYPGKKFIRMNANSYAGLSLRPDIIEEEEKATKKYGAGPGAVRFISGTFDVHIALEKKIAKFCGTEAAMLYSSAYMSTIGTFVSLTTAETIIISDELNHNCIINAMKLSRPKEKMIYKHLDMKMLEEQIQASIGKGNRVIVITDGIFSMRGDNAPLDIIAGLCEKYDDKFQEGILLFVDDSHGIGAFGKTGRGTIEYANAMGKVDVLVGTLGKSFGTNGGFVATSAQIVEYLHQKAPTYIYSNPISPGEAAGAMKALDIIDSPEGLKILEHLRKVTKMFKDGLIENGYETLPGEHPVVPLMVRDTAKNIALVNYLTERGVLATGLSFPVVPRGDEEIRFQISASHTEEDIRQVLSILKEYKNR
ncbi:aminotransferase class I/II-fold pyridoxal phosphate-dependent enzyme [bacterium]|nr:aminotransferase class I/II-fold pyridoxal phosphate-dependent enzyme [bacterium]